MLLGGYAPGYAPYIYAKNQGSAGYALRVCASPFCTLPPPGAFLGPKSWPLRIVSVGYQKPIILVVFVAPALPDPFGVLLGPSSPSVLLKGYAPYIYVKTVWLWGGMRPGMRLIYICENVAFEHP